jgi:hypothetical protein
MAAAPVKTKSLTDAHDLKTVDLHKLSTVLCLMYKRKMKSPALATTLNECAVLYYRRKKIEVHRHEQSPKMQRRFTKAESFVYLHG